MNQILVVMLMMIIFMFLVHFFVIVSKRGLIIEGLNTFNGRMAVDDQYFYDRLFDNTIYYSNTDNSTGWSRCVLSCPGKCVEYGITGNAYCFLKESNYGFPKTGQKDVDLFNSYPLAINPDQPNKPRLP